MRNIIPPVGSFLRKLPTKGSESAHSPYKARDVTFKKPGPVLAPALDRELPLGLSLRVEDGPRADRPK